MSYPDHVLEVQVDSPGWRSAQHDDSTGNNLLPHTSLTFQRMFQI